MEWAGNPSVLGSRSQLPLLTLSLAAQQFAWGVEQAYVSRGLLELGMSPQVLSLVWIAGPTCGLVVQPVIGAISDFSVNSYGRRRPFMLCSAVAVALGMLVFAWARELAAMWDLSGTLVATLGVLLVDIAINVCGATSRALIVDVMPIHRQPQANAWAGRMSAVGHLASYLLCSTKLEALGDQVKVVCVIASLLLVLGVGLTCGAVQERYLLKPPYSRWKQLKHVCSVSWQTATNLDPVLASIFKVQLFGWYSWFTLLFFGSEWAAEIWSAKHPSSSPDAVARAGSRALLAFSCSATLWSIVLPRVPVKIAKLWSASYVVYAVLAFSAYWITSYSTVIAVFALFGFSWAMTCWAPFSLTAERIHQLPVEPSLEDSASVLSYITINTVGSEDHAPLENQGEKSGIYLGLHNTAITLPQFLSTFGSFLVFRVLDTDKAAGRAIGVTLQIGSLTALLAAYRASQVQSAAPPRH